MLAMAAPLYAGREIRFSFTDNWDGTCTITYDVNEPDVAPVAMGLTVQVTSGAPITSVVLEDENDFMEIFMDAAFTMEDPCDPCAPGYTYGAGTPIALVDAPGEAQLALPWDPCDPCTVTANDGALFAISMGGLGGEFAKTKEPPKSGSITLGSDGGTQFELYVNAVRGGIIGEDGDPLIPLGLDDGPAKQGGGRGRMSECYGEADKRAQQGVGVGVGTTWYNSGKPICWCYPRQCHGDADGQSVGGAFAGYRFVQDNDLGIMALAWLVKDVPKGPGIVGESHPTLGRKLVCADFKHNKVGGAFAGFRRVQDSDLGEMALHWLWKETAAGAEKPPNTPGTTQAANDCISGSTEIHPLTGRPGVYVSGD